MTALQRPQGMEVYDKYFSFFRNSEGIVTAYLYEAWVMLQMQVMGPDPPACQNSLSTVRPPFQYVVHGSSRAHRNPCAPLTPDSARLC